MKTQDPEYKKLANQGGDKTAERTVVLGAEVDLLIESQKSQSEQQSRENKQNRGRSL